MEKEIVTITRYDINGRPISTTHHIHTDDMIIIGNQDMQPGIYFVNIAGHEINLTLKAIKI